jgi:hypothetical protein
LCDFPHNQNYTKNFEADLSCGLCGIELEVMAVVVPRNFKLLDEYDCSIGKEGKSKISGKHDGYIHYGLEEERDDNHNLHYWRASIIGPQEVR